MNDSGMTDSFERGENQQPNSNEQADSQGNSQYTGIHESLHSKVDIWRSEAFL